MKARIIRASDSVELIAVNDPTSGAYITGKLEGLGLPSVRRSRGTYPGRHGGYSGDPYWEPRLVTIDGLMIADTVLDMQTRRLAWANAFANLDDLELHIDYENGARYVIYCTLIGTPALDYVPLDPLRAPFYIELLADDPVIYDNTSGEALSLSIPKSVGGGVTWPITWPLVSAAGQGSVTVENPGVIPIYPTFVITGSMTNPLLTNETTGETLQLGAFTAPAGSEVRIDMSPRVHTVTLNGGNVANKLTNPFPWWALQPGSNSIRFSTSDSADTAVAEMVWRNGVMGI